MRREGRDTTGVAVAATPAIDEPRRLEEREL
jgi:hypothetical protein